MRITVRAGKSSPTAMCPVAGRGRATKKGQPMKKKPVENYQLLFFSMFLAHSNFWVMFWMEISFSSPSGNSS